MLAKVLSYSKGQMIQANSSTLTAFTKRGVYKAGTEPKVFVNKFTKVICQGITGKHVRSLALEISFLTYMYIGYFPY